MPDYYPIEIEWDLEEESIRVVHRTDGEPEEETYDGLEDPDLPDRFRTEIEKTGGKHGKVHILGRE